LSPFGSGYAGLCSIRISSVAKIPSGYEFFDRLQYKAVQRCQQTSLREGATRISIHHRSSGLFLMSDEE
jgi:hypothetical protein